MASSTFSGPVVSLNGFIGPSMTINGVPVSTTGSASAVNATAATLTIDPAVHSGKLVTMNRAAGVTATLPAATGSGNRYRFFVGTAVTTNNNIIRVANSSDVMVGQMSTALAAGGAPFTEAVGGTDDTITMNGTTTGGLIGSYVELVDQAVNTWFVLGFLSGSGTLASSMSAGV